MGLLAFLFGPAYAGPVTSLLAVAVLAFSSPYLALPALLLVAMCTLTLVFLTPNRRAGLVLGLRAYSILVEPLAVYALVLMTIRTWGRLWLALDVLFVGAAILALAGTVEAVGYALNPRPEVGGYHRVDSVFNHPNSLALYPTRVLPLFGTLGLSLPIPGARSHVYLGGVVPLGAAMLLSGSRGGWLAMVCAAALVAVLVRRWGPLLPMGVAGVGGVLLLVLTGQNRLSSLLGPGRSTVDARYQCYPLALTHVVGCGLVSSNRSDSLYR